MIDDMVVYFCTDSVLVSERAVYNFGI